MGYKIKNKQRKPNRMASPATPPPPSAADERKAEEQELDTFTYAMTLANASALPLAMKTAIDLGVFDILANAGEELTVEEIADRIPTCNPEAPAMLDRILRLLVSHQVVLYSMNGVAGQRKYRLTAVGKYFARDVTTGVSLAPLMALTHDEVYSESWLQLKDAILEGGKPFNRTHGMHLFEYTARDARFSQVYDAAMFNHTALVFKKLLQVYTRFQGLKWVVDVGGGTGVALGLLTSKYPHIEGINFDLPHVIQHAPPFPGVKHVEGDMFKSIPRGDAIILKWMLHDWDDEQCVKLLNNCYRALPAGGKVIVVEQILPMCPEFSTVAARDKSQVDTLSLVQSPGGKERTQNEICYLGISAGFSYDLFVSHVYHFVVVEFVKEK